MSSLEGTDYDRQSRDPPDSRDRRRNYAAVNPDFQAGVSVRPTTSDGSCLRSRRGKCTTGGNARRRKRLDDDHDDDNMARNTTRPAAVGRPSGRRSRSVSAALALLSRVSWRRRRRRGSEETRGRGKRRIDRRPPPDWPTSRLVVPFIRQCLRYRPVASPATRVAWLGLAAVSADSPRRSSICIAVRSAP